MKLRGGKNYTDKSFKMPSLLSPTNKTHLENKEVVYMQTGVPTNVLEDPSLKVSVSLTRIRRKTNGFSSRTVSYKNLSDFEELSIEHVKTNKCIYTKLHEKNCESLHPRQSIKISDDFSNFTDDANDADDAPIFTSTPFHSRFNYSDNSISKLIQKPDVEPYPYDGNVTYPIPNLKSNIYCEKASLEDHVFHDISLTKPSQTYFDKTEKQHSENISHKLDGTLPNRNRFLNENCDINIHHSLNHVQRSFFRQKRREWYLNRYMTGDKVYTNNFFFFHNWSYLFYKLSRRTQIQLYAIINVIISRMQIFFVKVCEHIRVLFCLHAAFTFVFKQFIYYTKDIYCHFMPSFHWFFKQEKQSSIFPGSIATSSKVDSQKKFLVSGFCYQVFLGLILFLLVVLGAQIYFLGHYRQSIPNLTQNGISNAYSLFLDEIPAWHIMASNSKLHSIERYFPEKSPVILFLHMGGYQRFTKIIELFQVLSSLGYHLIVPMNELNRDEVFHAWSSIKKMASNSIVYLWGDNLDFSSLSDYAKDFCSKSLPASGVVIGVEELIDQQQKLEMWSCNCTVVESNGVYHKYNNIRCPLTWQQHEYFYERIISCLQALHLK